ncbi:MAG TPA: VOC family protein [Polyangiaceae bacterium]|nr:VOC family protein [Polyangiaceae bacterium]
MTQFFHYVLRTTDVAAARAFYSAVLGNTELEIFPLHEQAVARGARPHWLGMLDVAEVEVATSTFARRGAVALGPKWVNPAGLEAAAMRDPGGAVVALGKPAPASAAKVPQPRIIWHLLNTADVEQAKANYSQLFGWEFKTPVDLAEHGVHHPFAWQPGGAPVGALSDIAQRPGVHPHWLFHFQVAALDPALEAVRVRGGLVLGPFSLPSGARIAVCDDEQGAAFALLEPRR